MFELNVLSNSDRQVFDGWEDINGNSISFPTMCDFKTKNIYAKFRNKKFSFVYHVYDPTNKNEIGQTTKEVEFNKNYSIIDYTELYTLDRNWEFKGWSYEPEGEVVYVPGDIVNAQVVHIWIRLYMMDKKCIYMH